MDINYLMKWKIGLLSILLLIPVLPVFGEHIGCPPLISTDQKVVGLPKGWMTTREKKVHELKNLTVYDGPPKEMASLIPDNDEDGLAQGYYVWKLTPGGLNGRNYWVECSYTNTDILLSKPLPKGTAECKATVDSERTINNLPVIKSVVCK